MPADLLFEIGCEVAAAAAVADHGPGEARTREPKQSASGGAVGEDARKDMGHAG
jgi:hypothetical protein